MDDSLSYESFLRGAQRAAHKAMDNHAKGDYDDFALFGGVAVERLAKAVLVSKNPVFLLDMKQGNPDLLLYFGGHLDAPEKIRTVGAFDAIKRLRKLDVLGPGETLDKLIELRNGTAHASVDDEAKALLPVLAESLETLLEHLELPVDEFWGDWNETVQVAVDKQRDMVERDVALQISQARQLFDRKFADHPEAKEKVLQEHRLNATVAMRNLVSVRESTGAFYLGRSIRCPACTSQAMLAFRVSSGEKLSEASLYALTCGLCNLTLNSKEEVISSGVEVALPQMRTVKVQLGETHAG
ncbi:hypothetical protein [Streptomyces gardneri]|uniref:hypothetical protein n=1 Tax=Streptomyces gardneri TaxID=66892 RepID=UPI003409D449